jgi:hypothetical protein
VQNQIYLGSAEAQPLLQAQPEITTKNLFNEFLAMQVDEVQIHPPVFVSSAYVTFPAIAHLGQQIFLL